MSRRQTRYKQFQRFYDTAQTEFDRLAARDPQCRRLRRSHSFYATPGSAAGGTDKRVTEVFFGKRPFDQVLPEMRKLQLPSPTLLVEHGARLRYDRLDNGRVLCH